MCSYTRWETGRMSAGIAVRNTVPSRIRKAVGRLPATASRKTRSVPSHAKARTSTGRNSHWHPQLLPEGGSAYSAGATPFRARSRTVRSRHPVYETTSRTPHVNSAARTASGSNAHSPQGNLCRGSARSVLSETVISTARGSVPEKDVPRSCSPAVMARTASNWASGTQYASARRMQARNSFAAAISRGVNRRR